MNKNWHINFEIYFLSKLRVLMEKNYIWKNSSLQSLMQKKKTFWFLVMKYPLEKNLKGLTGWHLSYFNVSFSF